MSGPTNSNSSSSAIATGNNNTTPSVLMPVPPPSTTSNVTSSHDTLGKKKDTKEEGEEGGGSKSTQGTHNSSTTSKPSTTTTTSIESNHNNKEQQPLEERELYAFGTTAENEILPPPPLNNNSTLSNSATPTPAGLESTLLTDLGQVGGKRTTGTGGGAAGGGGGNNNATGPLARAKRPKNVKFSPAKTGKQLARRAAAPGGGDILLPNNDFCDSCGGKGHFLCCEGGCLRSFHFGCLEPPLEIDEVPDESWFCKACRAAAQPPPRPPRGPLAELIWKVDTENPKAFSLNNDIKTFYKNVAVGINGEFLDSNEHRPPSKITGRAIGQEDRDGYRLKDKNGRAIICYHCSEAASPTRHRRIISCDFCDQHWHLDCLNPPMTGMPPPTRKWMCPLHSDHVLPKKRNPRVTSTVNIEHQGVPNNGDIIVLPQPERNPPEEYEEMTVNRIRYQVPEQNIILDFWGKVVTPRYDEAMLKKRGNKKSKRRMSPKKKRKVTTTGDGYESGNSSPLTDLTSSGGEEEDEEEEDGDIEMGGDETNRRRKRNLSQSQPPSTTNSALDHLALLAEVRYIDLLEGNSPSTVSNGSGYPFPASSSDPRRSSVTSRTGPRTSTGAPRVSGAANSSGVTTPGAGSPPIASPAPTTTGNVGRGTSPSLSPAPGGPTRTSATPQSELTVQSKEDLKALMQVRKLLLSQGQAQGSAKTTMLSFLEGAPIIPKLAFVNNGKAAPWQRPWDAQKDGPRPAPAQSPKAAPSPIPRSAPTIEYSLPPPRKAETTTSATTPAATSLAPTASTSTSVPPPSSRPSVSPSLSTSNLPTPYASASENMPFQLPAFRPPGSTTPQPPTPKDLMDVDRKPPPPKQ